MRHDRDFETFPCEWLRLCAQRQEGTNTREHSSCSQVKGHTRPQTYANLRKGGDFAKGCDLRGCADSAGVSDSLPTGEARTHNPLVLGSNPSGPTNQPRSGPETWVTQRTDHIGNTFGPNGFSSG